MNESPPTLHLDHVSRSYGNSRPALRDVSLHINSGDFLAITGKSGSGKSTLLNVIGLLDTGWAGNYSMDSVDLKSLNERELNTFRGTTFGFVFQSSYANPYETVLRNATLGLSIQGLPLTEQSVRAMHALLEVDLASKADQLARELSGGERQRLAIARAVATGPTIIIADEPTGNLDTETGTLVMQLLTKLNSRGTTIILVTHDLEVAAYASRIAVMRDGTLSEVSNVVTRQSPREYQATGNFKRHGRAITELLFRAINNITSRPLRSLSLILAFALAFAGLIGSAGIATTAAEQIASRISLAARDEVRVSVPAADGRLLRDEWTQSIRLLEEVEEVGELATLDAASARTFSGSRSQVRSEVFSGSTLGADSDYLAISGVKTSPAGATKTFNAQGSTRVALVGRSIASELGVAEGTFGVEVWVQGEPYNVVGVITASPGAPNLLTSVVVPVQELPNVASELIVRTSPGYAAAVAEAVPLAIDPASPGSVAVATAAELRNLRVGVQTDLNGLLAAISGALLGIAILSGASAMFLAVQSRTQELALIRALGLSRRRVALLFVFEGAALGLSGAMVGIAGGVFLSAIIAAFRGWTAVAPWQEAAIAPLLGAIAGAIAAFFPAVKAARVDPAEAIR